MKPISCALLAVSLVATLIPCVHYTLGEDPPPCFVYDPYATRPHVCECQDTDCDECLSGVCSPPNEIVCTERHVETGAATGYYLKSVEVKCYKRYNCVPYSTCNDYDPCRRDPNDPQGTWSETWGNDNALTGNCPEQDPDP